MKWKFCQIPLKYLKGTNVEDRAVAISTTRGKQVVIIWLAIRPAIALEEVPRPQFLIAMRAGEVFRMPSSAQSGDHLLYKTILYSLVFNTQT